MYVIHPGSLLLSHWKQHRRRIHYPICCFGTAVQLVTAHISGKKSSRAHISRKKSSRALISSSVYASTLPTPELFLNHEMIGIWLSFNKSKAQHHHPKMYDTLQFLQLYTRQTTKRGQMVFLVVKIYFILILFVKTWCRNFAVPLFS